MPRARHGHCAKYRSFSGVSLAKSSLGCGSFWLRSCASRSGTRLVCKAAVAATAAGALVLGAATANADTDPVDPSYGRMDGDIEVVLGAGAAIAPRGLRAEGE